MRNSIILPALLLASLLISSGAAGDVQSLRVRDGERTHRPRQKAPHDWTLSSPSGDKSPIRRFMITTGANRVKSSDYKALPKQSTVTRTAPAA